MTATPESTSSLASSTPTVATIIYSSSARFHAKVLCGGIALVTATVSAAAMKQRSLMHVIAKRPF